MRLFIIACLSIFASALLAGQPGQITNFTFTTPETNMVVENIPTTNSAAAKAHIRAQLEQKFAKIKNELIDLAIQSYDETQLSMDDQYHYHAPEGNVDGEADFLARSGGTITACQKSIYDEHGDWTGKCQFPCYECLKVFILGGIEKY